MVTGCQEEHIGSFDELPGHLVYHVPDPTGRVVGQPTGVEPVLKVAVAIMEIVDCIRHHLPPVDKLSSRPRGLHPQQTSPLLCAKDCPTPLAAGWGNSHAYFTILRMALTLPGSLQYTAGVYGKP